MRPSDQRPAQADAPRGKGRPRIMETAGPSLADILNLVRIERATTRQEIERTSEFSRAVVADRLGTLTELGLVDESESGIATGGRAPRLVRFAAERGRILVAALDQTALGVGIADLSGRLLLEHHEAADLTAPAATICDRLVTLFRWILDRQAAGVQLWGISLSVPGTVPGTVPGIADTHFLDHTPPILPSWESFAFVETLMQRFNVPVWMRSSVETMTMGELFVGAGAGLQTMLFIKVGKRIGAGLVIDGKLYRGAQGATGLIGSLPVQGADRIGTLDAMAGSEMIAQEGRAAAERGSSPVLADIQRRGGEVNALDVAHAAQMGDAAAIEILSQSGRLIGQVVATLANTLNPEIIVLSGSIAQTNDILLAAVREAVYGASHPSVTRDLRILRSQLGASAGLAGAAMVATEAIFAQAYLRDWVMLGTPVAHPAFVQLAARINTMRGPAPQQIQPPAQTLAQTLAM